MEQKLKFILLLIASTLFFILMAWVLPIRYEENDDVVMCMIANGLIGGQPDCHLVFMNSIIGSILALLYSCTIQVEWYSLLLSIIHILSVTIIVNSLWCNTQIEKRFKVLITLLLVVVWAVMIACFQFTTTAGLCTIAGYLLIRDNRKFISILGIIWCVIGSMIRLESAGLVLLLLLPIIVSDIFVNKRLIIKYATLLLCIFGVNVIDRCAYSSPEWEKYVEYNSIRGSINDNPNAEIGYQHLPKSITKEDYANLLSFNPDIHIMDISAIRAISKSIKDELRRNPWTAFANLKQLVKYWIPILCLCCLLSCIAFQLKKGKWVPIVCMALFLLVLIYLGMFASCKNRVFLCMLMVMLYYLCRYASFIPKYIGVFCLALLIAKYANQAYKVHNNRVDYDFQSELVDLCSENESCFIAGIPIEEINPFTIHTFPFRPLGLGWLTGNPLQPELQDGYLGFIDYEVCIISPPPPFALHIHNELLRNYSVETEILVIKEGNKYSKYKLLTK